MSGDFGKWLLIAGISVVVLYLVFHVPAAKKLVTGAA